MRAERDSDRKEGVEGDRAVEDLEKETLRDLDPSDADAEDLKGGRACGTGSCNPS